MYETLKHLQLMSCEGRIPPASSAPVCQPTVSVAVRLCYWCVGIFQFCIKAFCL